MSSRSKWQNRVLCRGLVGRICLGWCCGNRCGSGSSTSDVACMVLIFPKVVGEVRETDGICVEFARTVCILEVEFLQYFSQPDQLCIADI